MSDPDIAYEIKTELSRLAGETRASVSRQTAEQKAYTDAMFKAVEGKVIVTGDRMKALENGLDEIKTVLARRPMSGGDADMMEIRREASPESKAFGKYIRYGEKVLDVEEARALSVGSDPNAGYLAPRELVRQMLQVIT